MSIAFKKRFLGFDITFKASYDEGELGLSGKWERFFDEAKEFLGDRIFKDYLRRFAYGIDASCYRYIPKIVIWAKNESEIQKILQLSKAHNTPLTFRASGTSLCGQACCEGILVVCNTFFKDIKVQVENNEATSIWCDCGVIGCDANAALKPYSKKIGPDPATINNALIGGIFSNNSSGMCCGVKQNSYQTVKSVRVVLGDGSILDTSDTKSLEEFYNNHSHITQGLLDLRKEILEDKDLTYLINRKFKIKNTTGYALNALVDFEEVKDIFNHIFIGSEGTLGFISKVEYECVKDFSHKACALLFYDTLSLASNAIKILAKNDDIVSAAEIMDYASLVSVQNLEGMPSEILQIQEGNCAILLQLEADSKEELERNIAKINKELEGITSKFGNAFSFNAKEQESWWKIRKGILPLAAATRPSGSTVITEDICFEIDYFTQGIEGISELFKRYKFKGIIFGHALSGNVHFIITPILGDLEERARFGELMDALVSLVVGFGGSVKAEHGTGRMMAPYVEEEWGSKAYAINQKIKALFDASNLINPDVILSEDKKIHLKNLKPAESNLIESYLDACMECGFCEKICPSKNLTLTPRQRIAVYREIARLEAKVRDKKEELELKALKGGFEYFGVETCATCSMCATLCPLEIDSGKIASKLSTSDNTLSNTLVSSLATHLDTTTKLGGMSATLAGGMQKLLGEQTAKTLTQKLHNFCKTPVLLEHFPTKNTYKLGDKILPKATLEVVYFTSCINRMFAPSKDAPDTRSLQEVFESLCQKANCTLRYPQNLSNLCCSKAYKNHKQLASKLAKEAYLALKEESRNGELPIVCDHSACSLELLKHIQAFSKEDNTPPLKFYDLPAFVLKYLIPHLTLTPKSEKVALYTPCSLRNLSLKGQEVSWEGAVFELAKLCGVEVCYDTSTKCCGFAGNKGFLTPELNKSALEYYGSCNSGGDPRGAKRGFSTSSTCEIGLSDRCGFTWQHIIYLVESCA